MIKSEPISTPAPIPTPALHASHAAAVANVPHPVAAINNNSNNNNSKNGLLRHAPSLPSLTTPSVLSSSPKMETCFEGTSGSMGHLPTAVTPVLSTNTNSSSSSSNTNNNNNNGYINQQHHSTHPDTNVHLVEQHSLQDQHHHHHHHHHHSHHSEQQLQMPQLPPTHHQQHHMHDLLDHPQPQDGGLNYTQLYPVNESIVSSSSSLGHHELMHQYPDTTTTATNTTAAASSLYFNNNYYYDGTIDVSAASLIRPFSANSNSCSSSSESERQLSTGNASIVNGTSPQTTYSDLSHSFELNYFSDSSSHNQHHHQQQQQQHHLPHSNTITELTSPQHQGPLHLTQLDAMQQQHPAPNQQSQPAQHLTIPPMEMQQQHGGSSQSQNPHPHHHHQQPQQQHHHHIVANSFTETFKNVNGPHYTSVIVEPQHYINNEYVH